jgi:hypothetical protein
MHAQLVMHEIELREVEVAPLASGEVPRLQADPSQFKTVVCSDVSVAPALPTAVHTVALMQSTPERLFNGTEPPCVLSGAVAMVQVEPFQDSIRLCMSVPLTEEPTAWQKLSPAHETSASSDEVEPLPTLGVVWAVHVPLSDVPDTATVCPLAVPWPTAMHEAPMQVIPASTTSVVEGGEVKV